MCPSPITIHSANSREQIIHREILTFWFDETPPALWWKSDPDLDARIAGRFGGTLEAALQGELFAWRRDAAGRLAEIIVLDQFSRNVFRGTPRAFAQDPMALALAQEAIAAGAERSLSAVERSFLYMPFMHSESRLIHEWAVKLFRANGIAQNLEFELKHQAIIERFGRYPHRNEILGRVSTAEEREFLKQPGSSF